MGKPISGVGKRVPEDVGGNADEKGENDQGKAGKGVYGKSPGTEMESFACTSGQTGGEGFLGVAVKEPEHGQAEREVDGKDAEPVVAEGVVVLKRNEVFEIGSHAANDQSRHDETGAAKRPGCGGVGDGKGHSLNYDCFGGGGHVVGKDRLNLVGSCVAIERC